MHDQLQDGGHDIIHKRYAMLTAEQKNPASVIESNLLGFFFITVEIHCTYMEIAHRNTLIKSATMNHSDNRGCTCSAHPYSNSGGG